MLDTEPPADVIERLCDRDADARLEHYRQALESEETENADE